MEEQKRHSGFETMRILSMVMIVLMHGIGHGGRVYPQTVL